MLTKACRETHEIIWMYTQTLILISTPKYLVMTKCLGNVGWLSSLSQNTSTCSRQRLTPPAFFGQRWADASSFYQHSDEVKCVATNRNKSRVCAPSYLQWAAYQSFSNGLISVSLKNIFVLCCCFWFMYVCHMRAWCPRGPNEETSRVCGTP